MRLRDVELTYWHYLSIFFAVVAVVAALGEWVFHWWEDPGQWVAAGSFGLAILTLGFGASKLDMRRMHRRFDDQGRDLRSLVRGQDGLLDGQQRLVEGQQRLVEGQERQTRLLEQVVLSFRRGQEP